MRTNGAEGMALLPSALREGVNVFPPVDRRLFVPFALLSLLTMPLTAVWFTFLGFFTFATAAAYASTQRSFEDSMRALRSGASIGAALLVGPAVYVSLALVT